MSRSNHRSSAGACFCAVDDDPVHPGFNGDFNVFSDPARSDLNEYRNLVVGDVSELLYLEHHIVCAEDIPVPRVAVEIDPFRKLPEFGNLLGDFGSHQMAGKPGFRTDTDYQFQGIGGFNVSQRKSHPAGRYLNNLFIRVLTLPGQ